MQFVSYGYLYNNVFLFHICYCYYSVLFPFTMTRTISLPINLIDFIVIIVCVYILYMILVLNLAVRVLNSLFWAFPLYINSSLHDGMCLPMRNCLTIFIHSFISPKVRLISIKGVWHI